MSLPKCVQQIRRLAHDKELPRDDRAMPAQESFASTRVASNMEPSSLLLVVGTGPSCLLLRDALRQEALQGVVPPSTIQAPSPFSGC